MLLDFQRLVLWHRYQFCRSFLAKSNYKLQCVMCLLSFWNAEVRGFEWFFFFLVGEQLANSIFTKIVLIQLIINIGVVCCGTLTYLEIKNQNSLNRSLFWCETKHLLCYTFIKKELFRQNLKAARVLTCWV